MVCPPPLETNPGCATGGVHRLYHLMPLSLLQVPILILNRTTVDYILDAIVPIEYFVYGFTLLLLLPAFNSSLGEFLVRSRALLSQSAIFVPAPFTYKTLTAPVSASINKRLFEDSVDRRFSRQPCARHSCYLHTSLQRASDIYHLCTRRPKQ